MLSVSRFVLYSRSQKSGSIILVKLSKVTSELLSINFNINSVTLKLVQGNFSITFFYK